MSSIRKQQSKTTRKTVVKPILTNPFTLQWPTLSAAAQSQIEAALRDVLMPLVHAREAQFKSREQEDMVLDQPVASTSTSVPTNVDTEMQSIEAENVETSNSTAETGGPHKPTRQEKRAKAAARLEKRNAGLTPGTHQMTLKSGKVLEIPDQAVPEKLKPKLLLDKGKAIEERPEICQSLLIGINVVTKALESEVQNGRRRLAGLPPLEAVVTSQDSLRMFIPAPRLSTRRQRRELRKELHPEEKRLRKAVKGPKVVIHMPHYLAGIPKNDAALLHTLEEGKQELVEVGSDEGFIKVVETAIEGVTGKTIFPEIARPSSTCPVSSATDPSASPPTTVQLPSGLVESLLFDVGLGEATRSILISLLMRYDSRWFSTRNVVQAQAADRKKEKEKGKGKGRHIANSTPAMISAISSTAKPIRIVFVATGDINPLEIVHHLLATTAARNSTSIALRRKVKAEDDSDPNAEDGDVYLIPMGKGFEEKLCELLAIRRAAVLAITDTSSPGFETLLRLVKHHFPSPISASWLIPIVNDHLTSQGLSIIPTHVKHLQTSVPVDMKAVRAEKKAAKGENGRKRKSSGGLDGSAALPVKKVKQNQGLLSTQAE